MIEQRGATAAHPSCVPLASQVRKAALLAIEYSGSDEFRGASIHLCDLAESEIRDCEVSGGAARNPTPTPVTRGPAAYSG